MTRTIKAAIAGTALLGGVVLGASPAFGQSPSGGPIKVWVTDSSTSSNNAPDPIVITGAFADYGSTRNVNSSGKPDANGTLVKVSLKKGTFTVDGSQLDNAFNNVNPTDFSSSSCSASFTAGPVPVPIVADSGTGDYRGISGTITMTGQAALILPKTKSGSCNQSNNATPVAAWGIITGTGTISF